MKERIVYWYRLKYKISPRKKKMIIESTEEIFEGTFLDFIKELEAGKINIGPFNDKSYVEWLLEPKKIEPCFDE